MRIAAVSVQGVRVNARGNWLFLRIRSRDGLEGLAEISHSGDDARVVALVRELTPALIGRDASQHQVIVRDLPSRDRVAATAVSGIEQALWDLTARTLGVSVQTLLGGPLSTTIQLYANINRALSDRSIEAFARGAREAAGAGFRAIKIAPFDGVQGPSPDPRAVELGIARIAAVREAIGPALRLMVDCHGRFQREQAIAVARTLEPLSLYWLEDLLWAEDDPDGVAAVGAQITQPMAAGERALSPEQFYPIVSRRLAGTVMPDIKHCGGLGGARRIAALAEAAGLRVSPHNPAGPVATLASAHFAATLHDFVHLEYAWGEVPFRATLLEPAERIVDGSLVLPLGPGFGAQLSAAALAAHGFEV